MNKHSSPQQPPVVLNGHHNGNPGIIVPNRLTKPQGQRHASEQAPSPHPAPQPSLAARQATQPHAPREARLGHAGENDPLPPPLDEEGLPKTRPIVFISPVPPSQRPAKDTARQRVIERLEQHFPVRAPELEADLDEGVQAARQRHLDLERIEWERVACENAEIQRRNIAIETRRAALESERDATLKPDQDRLLTLQERLAEVNGVAGTAVARAHGLFDPARVEVETVRNSMRMPLAALAGRLGLPFVPSDEGWGEDFARWTDIGSGALFGTSLGLVGGLFEASALKSLQPGTLAMWLVTMGLGAVIAVEASRALVGDAARLSEARWLGLSFKGWAPALVKTVFTTAAVLVIWTVVDGQGIMKLASLHAANSGGGGVGALVTLAAGAAAAVPFAAFALVRGARQGRLNGVKLLLQSAQEDDLRERPEVAPALEAVSQVCEIERQADVVRQRILQTQAPFDAEIAHLASQVREPRFALSDEAQQRLRRSHDEWAKAFATWKESLAELIQEVEPLGQNRRSAVQGERTGQLNGPRQGLLTRLSNWWRRLRR